MIIRIGRSKNNDVVINNMTVSREHAVLEVVDGRITLRDAGSRGGTYVVIDGKPEKTSYKIVSETDQFQLGSEILTVKSVIEQASKKSREATYERNPVTGEIIRK